MKIVFVTNYFNHHQSALAQALHRQTGGNFLLIETKTMGRERRELGYGREEKPAYVCHWDTDPKRFRQEILDADVVLAGSAPERCVRQRIRRGKLVFRYGERPLKNGPEPLKYLPRRIRWNFRNPMGKPVYLLAASAYAAQDYKTFGLFRGKIFRWGYFPETKRYSRLPRKEENSLLWVGRFLDWKHPEEAIAAAKNARDRGFRVHLNMIGMGPMEQQLRRIVSVMRLEDTVSFLGAMPPEQVRDWMERSSIFLHTSDYHEGWGAVVNEAMNSGCAVVASSGAGSVPFLIRHGENGLTYSPGDVDTLTENILHLLRNPESRRAMGTQACQTITTLWNGETAARRLIALSSMLLGRAEMEPIDDGGPCTLVP